MEKFYRVQSGDLWYTGPVYGFSSTKEEDGALFATLGRLQKVQRSALKEIAAGGYVPPKVAPWASAVIVEYDLVRRG